MTTYKKIEILTNPGVSPRVIINDREMPREYYNENQHWLKHCMSVDPSIEYNHYKKAHQKIKDMLYQQGQKGNYDYDEYMRGLYNGIELALCCIEDREPTLKSYPHVREV